MGRSSTTGELEGDVAYLLFRRRQEAQGEAVLVAAQGRIAGLGARQTDADQFSPFGGILEEAVGGHLVAEVARLAPQAQQQGDGVHQQGDVTQPLLHLLVAGDGRGRQPVVQLRHIEGAQTTRNGEALTNGAEQAILFQTGAGARGVQQVAGELGTLLLHPLDLLEIDVRQTGPVAQALAEALQILDEIGTQVTTLQQLLQIEQPLEEGDMCPGLVTLQIVADLGKQGLQTKIGPAFFIEGKIVNHA